MHKADNISPIHMARSVVAMICAVTTDTLSRVVCVTAPLPALPRNYLVRFMLLNPNANDGKKEAERGPYVEQMNL